MRTNLVLLKDFLPPYKVGDRVQLKSGSPSLTVTHCEGGQIEVVWFEKTERHQCVLPAAALRKIRDAP
jgi:uncharacterized protein YodC (DUF2158 family)